MTIKIVTDSTCDLPEAIVAQYGITVIPLYINIGDKGYLDGIELSRQVFYQQLSDYTTSPTTGCPSPEKFYQVYEGLADEGATEILSIHLSETLSATITNARLGAQQPTSVPITVLDSQQLTLGLGFTVITAAKAAIEGRSMAEIIELVNDQIARTYVFAAIDTLEFLRRSGRMNAVLAGMGSILQVKPLLKMHNGKVTTERLRTRKRAIQRVIRLLETQAPLEQVAIVHSNAVQRADLLRQQVQHLLPQGEVLVENITPVLGAHLGPDALGFACVTQKRKNGGRSI